LDAAEGLHLFQQIQEWAKEREIFHNRMHQELGRASLQLKRDKQKLFLVKAMAFGL
jgi:hypothetical protein